MKKILLLMIVLFVVVGCGGEKQEIENIESFSNEYYTNFSEVKSIVKYLNKTASDVTVLKEEKNNLVFCLTVDNSIDIHDETIISYANYVKLLEKDGYIMSLLDGTVSSMFVLEKDKYRVTITTISDIEQWKKDQKEIDISKIKDQNLVCQVTLK